MSDIITGINIYKMTYLIIGGIFMKYVKYNVNVCLLEYIKINPREPRIEAEKIQVSS